MLWPCPTLALRGRSALWSSRLQKAGLELSFEWVWSQAVPLGRDEGHFKEQGPQARSLLPPPMFVSSAASVAVRKDSED